MSQKEEKSIKYNLLSSVIIAKSIIDNYSVLINSKELDRQYLGDVEFDINKKSPLHFCVKPLLELVKGLIRKAKKLDFVSLKVYQEESSIEEINDGRMAGLVFNTDDSHYVILLDKAQSYCTQRFALCKELCQLLTECLPPNELIEANQGNPKVIEVVEELIERYFHSKIKQGISEEFKSTEGFAYSIALELMIPYTLRNKIKEEYDVDKGKAAKMLSITQEALDEYMKTYFEITTPVYDYVNR